MDASQIKIVGVGSLGCAWAIQSFNSCKGLAQLLLVDADENLGHSFNQDKYAFLEMQIQGQEMPHYLRLQSRG